MLIFPSTSLAMCTANGGVQCQTHAAMQLAPLEVPLRQAWDRSRFCFGSRDTAADPAADGHEGDDRGIELDIIDKTISSPLFWGAAKRLAGSEA